MYVCCSVLQCVAVCCRVLQYKTHTVCVCLLLQRKEQLQLQHTPHIHIHTKHSVSLLDILNLPREHRAVYTDWPSDPSPAEHCKEKKKGQPPISKDTTNGIKRNTHICQKGYPKKSKRDNQRDQKRPPTISKETHVDPWTTRHTGFQRLKRGLQLQANCVGMSADLDSSSYCIGKASILSRHIVLVCL